MGSFPSVVRILGPLNCGFSNLHFRCFLLTFAVVGKDPPLRMNPYELCGGVFDLVRSNHKEPELSHGSKNCGCSFRSNNYQVKPHCGVELFLSLLLAAPRLQKRMPHLNSIDAVILLRW